MLAEFLFIIKISAKIFQKTPLRCLPQILIITNLLTNTHCIKYIGNNKFICLPLNQDDSVNYEGTWYPKLPYEHNYNSKTYLIENKNNRFYCNCQGWNAKEEKNESRTDGVQCSHSLSLILCFKLNYFKKIGNFYENERQNF